MLAGMEEGMQGSNLANDWEDDEWARGAGSSNASPSPCLGVWNWFSVACRALDAEVDGGGAVCDDERDPAELGCVESFDLGPCEGVWSSRLDAEGCTAGGFEGSMMMAGYGWQMDEGGG